MKMGVGVRACKLMQQKTKAMATGPVNYRYNINLQDNKIELTDSLKILGVT